MRSRESLARLPCPEIKSAHCYSRLLLAASDLNSTPDASMSSSLSTWKNVFKWLSDFSQPLGVSLFAVDIMA